MSVTSSNCIVCTLLILSDLDLECSIKLISIIVYFNFIIIPVKCIACHVYGLNLGSHLCVAGNYFIKDKIDI